MWDISLANEIGERYAETEYAGAEFYNHGMDQTVIEICA